MSPTGSADSLAAALAAIVSGDQRDPSRSGRRRHQPPALRVRPKTLLANLGGDHEPDDPNWPRSTSTTNRTARIAENRLQQWRPPGDSLGRPWFERRDRQLLGRQRHGAASALESICRNGESDRLDHAITQFNTELDRFAEALRGRHRLSGAPGQSR